MMASRAVHAALGHFGMMFFTAGGALDDRRRMVGVHDCFFGEVAPHEDDTGFGTGIYEPNHCPV
jgi:hypothetical protein